MRLKTLLTRHFPVVIILILFTVLTIHQSITLPLGEAADETDHYQYLRFVARTWHPPLTEAERQEAGFKGGLAPLYYWLTAWPIVLVGEDSIPDIRRVDARPERHIPNDGLGINHVLHTLDEQWPWQGQPLAWHLVRFFSLPMGWVTLIATYALVRRLLPEQKLVAISATAFVAFLPRFVISSAVINDDNLIFALIALLLLVQVRILQDNQAVTGKVMAAFGALFALTLLTKYFSLILIPEIIFTLLLYQKSRVMFKRSSKNTASRPRQQSPLNTYLPSRSSSRRQRPPLLIFLITLFVIAGPWFIFIVFRFNRVEDLGFIPGLAASLGEPQITEGLVGLLSGQSIRPVAATYTLPEWFSLLYRSFWFEYGWMQLFAPSWIYTLFSIFVALLLIGLIGKLWINRTIIQNAELIENPKFKSLLRTVYHALRPVSPITWLLTLHAVLFVVVPLARYVLSATIDTGQGRHLYPALPVIALLVALGLSNLYQVIRQLPLSNQAHRFLPIAGFGVAATFFLLPAAISLMPPSTAFNNSSFILHPSSFIAPYYRTLPVSNVPILLPPDQRQSIEFDKRLWLVGLDATETISAGNTLPITLYWHAEDEAQQDYLTSLCLQDEDTRPVACWRGHFADGQYPARAWERGDTVIDKIFIPTPACDELPAKSYSLHLDIWPLNPDSPAPKPSASPVFQHTFTEPQITIKASNTLTNSTKTVDMWQANRRLITDTDISLGQSLTQITYTTDDDDDPSALFQLTNEPKNSWMPVPQLDTPLYLPCESGPTPFAHLSHFLANPTLSSGTYQATSDTKLPDIILSLRDRVFDPVTSTLTFSNTLAPLSLKLPDQPTLHLDNSSGPTTSSPTPYSLLPTSYSQLPITIRWQARRWMADPLVVSLKLLDKEFAVGGERVATLGNRYPNVLWVPTEIVEETYPLQLKPDAPPGLYQLEISLLRQDKALPDGFEYLSLTDGTTILDQNLYPLTVRLLDPAHDTAPLQPLTAQVGDSIQLTGYEMNPIFSDSPPTVSVTLYWQASRKISADYTVFVQMVGPNGQMGAQWDNPPQGGRYPTSAWSEDTVIDRYNLTFREGASPGDYRLLVGMYDSATGERLPVTVKGQPQPDNAIELTTFSLTP